MRTPNARACVRCGNTRADNVNRYSALCTDCKKVARKEAADAELALPPGKWVAKGGFLRYVPDWIETPDPDTNRPECGTNKGYGIHLNNNEPTCEVCKAAHRDARRKRRGTKPRKLLPCGTHSAFNRHKKAGETPCWPCIEAERVYQTGRIRKRKKEAA